MPPPKDVHILIPRTCAYVTLHDKQQQNFADTIRNLKWSYYPQLAGWGQCNQKGLCHGTREVGELV